MSVLVQMDRCIPEHLILVALGPIAHVFLAQCPHLGGDVGLLLRCIYVSDASQEEREERGNEVMTYQLLG